RVRARHRQPSRRARAPARRGAATRRTHRATSRRGVARRQAGAVVRARDQPQPGSRVMKYSTFDCLDLFVDGPVGWLVNDRPEQRNAMSAHMRDEFAIAWKELDADRDVRVIVHTGNGRAFQTGVDVTEIASDGVGMERYRESVERWDLHFTAWHQHIWKPVIT